jgi:hypothetical protein
LAAIAWDWFVMSVVLQRRRYPRISLRSQLIVMVALSALAGFAVDEFLRGIRAA